MESQESSTAVSTVTTRSAGIRFGLISAVIGIVYFVILNSLGVDLSQGPASWCRGLIAIVILVLAQKYFKDNSDGFMSYGQGIGIGFWMGAVSSVISSIFTFLYVKFIDSSFIEIMKETQLKTFQEKGMTEDQIDQAMKFSEMFMTPGAMLGFGIVFGIIITLIFALIVTIFTQKKAPEQAF
jgi:hypothetical protein